MSAEALQKSERPAEAPGRPVGTVGTDIRALRKSRSMTLSQLADKLQRSIGFISQIERGLSQPSINDLRLIAELFDVPLSFFFGTHGNEPSENHIVRGGSRRRIGSAEGGLIEELLSPNLAGSFEIIRSEFAAGADLKDAVQRQTEEAGYVVSGRIDLEISGVWYPLEPGDSFRIAGEPYRWRNDGSETAVLIWVIAPPTY